MRNSARFALLASVAVLLVTAGCSQSETADSSATSAAQHDTSLHTEKLPRVASAKELYASAPNTIFTTAGSVLQTADLVDKALAADGWQSYERPFTTRASTDVLQVRSLKKGHFGLDVLITAGQNNVTNVQYNAAAIKNDLPFPKDATHIAFDPERPYLTLASSAPVADILNFYRQQLAPLGWSLWSQARNGAAAVADASGELTRSGAFAYYIRDDRTFAVLRLDRADANQSNAGQVTVKFEVLQPDYLASLERQYFNTDTPGSPLVDLATVPKLDGAAVNISKTDADRVAYSVAGSVPQTVVAITKLLAADGWQAYAAPLEKPSDFLRNFKKGALGLSVSFTMTDGRDDRSSVEYIADRLSFALAVPADVTDIVFDTYRPYLSAVTAQSTDAALDFYRNALAARGWSPLSAADTSKLWPGAQLDGTTADAVHAYFTRGNQHPILLTLARGGDGKTAIEIKTPPFAEPQQLEAGDAVYDLPVPKLHKEAGGRRGERQTVVTASVPAEVGTVLAFYRKELGALNWTEQAQGTAVHADDATLNFTTPDGSAVLKLAHKYDLTSVNLTLTIAKPAAKPEQTNVSVNDALNQMQQMIQEANTAAARLGGASAKPSAPAPSGPEPALRARADNTAPLPVPESAGDVDFDGDGGRVEFDSTSSVRAVADFYRAVMKQQGWALEPTVINNANMVSLNFNKARKSVSITIMRMGDKTNVSADGAALRVARSDSAPAADASPKVEAQASVQASAQSSSQSSSDAGAEDADVAESNGLPMPKNHTMSTGTKTPFRSDLKVSAPLPLSDVLGFYRRELGKRGWQEVNQQASAGNNVATDSAVLHFTTPEGPAVLNLTRADGATDVDLVARNPDAASKAGIMPKPGQAKVLLGNAGPAAQTITFNNQPIKVAAGAGKNGPDGPSLDLPPGTYKYSIHLPGKPAQIEQIELHADETWGLMILPVGVLPLQAY